jgi:hypothetical protein
MEFLDVLAPIVPMCGILVVVMLVGIGFNYLWLKLMYRRIRACPECEAKGSGAVIDTQEIIVSNNVDYRRRKPVRIKETKVIDKLQCEVCQHTWTRSFTREERVRMEDVIHKP